MKKQNNVKKMEEALVGVEIQEVDLVMVIRMRAPWYPPSDRPPNAAIAIIDEDPHRISMVYQSHQADMYLEGNVAQTLRDLAAAMQDRDVSAEAIEARRAVCTERHDALMTKRAAEHAEARRSKTIAPVWLCACLGEVMPQGCYGSISCGTSHRRASAGRGVWARVWAWRVVSNLPNLDHLS